MSRFVNIGQKGGGNYLPENATWAKQTIAHNTLVQDGISHFGGLYEVGSQHHSDLRFFDASNDDVQVVSASEINAYPDTEMVRTMAMIKDKEFKKAFVLDLFKVASQEKHEYDLPFYYFGQILDTNFDFTTPNTLKPLGDENGYQHLYLEATGESNNSHNQFSWIDRNKFYTLTTAAEQDDEILLARIGANDPSFNLRKDPAIIIRRPDVKETVFVSVVEPHGNYNPVSESATNSNSNISELTVLEDNKNYTVVSIKTVQGSTRLFILSNQDTELSTTHEVEVNGKSVTWTGPYYYSNM